MPRMPKQSSRIAIVHRINFRYKVKCKAVWKHNGNFCQNEARYEVKAHNPNKSMAYTDLCDWHIKEAFEAFLDDVHFDVMDMVWGGRTESLGEGLA